MTRIFSPGQILVIAFLGGPFAAVYVLWRNFVALGDGAGARSVLVWGVVLSVLLLAVLPFLPESFPNYLIPIVYTLAARFYADKYQLTKQAIAESDAYDFQTVWMAVGVIVGFLAAFVIVAMAEIYLLDAIGVAPLI